jgi:hypothetical protein
MKANDHIEIEPIFGFDDSNNGSGYVNRNAGKYSSFEYGSRLTELRGRL